MKSYSLFSTSSASSMVLNEEDQVTLGAIKRVINSNDNKKIDGLIDSLIKYPVDLLQTLYKADTEFKDFCQKNTKFQEELANKLQRHGFSNVEITSMDGKEHFYLFEFLIAVKKYGQYCAYDNLPPVAKTSEARFNSIRALNIACELGLYEALTARCEENANLFLSPDEPSEKKEKALASIVHDTQRLSNLYWKLGYIQAGCILQELVEKTAEATSHWKDDESREEKDRMAIFYQESIKNRLCASFLEDYPESKKIELGLTEGKGYVAYIMDKKGIKIPTTWDEAKIKLRSLVKNNDATYERLLNTAKREIDTILKPSSSSTSEAKFMLR